MNRHRPNYFAAHDVSGTVDLRDAHAVADAVCAIAQARYPGFEEQPLRQGFSDLNNACAGCYPGLLACDTPYHDLRHFLDAALLMARLLDGYAVRANAIDPVSAEQFSVAVLLALFHDVGMLRRADEGHLPGANFLGDQEQRSVDFMQVYLAQGTLARFATQAGLILVTDLTRPVRDSLQGLPVRQVRIGQMLGTADLLSQMSGRYYLEHCRDALYAEFVTAAACRTASAQTAAPVLFDSPQDLLRKTPAFFEDVVKKRLDHDFAQAYDHLRSHFGGEDPYMRGLQRNLTYLAQLIALDDFSGLRRKPPRPWHG